MLNEKVIVIHNVPNGLSNLKNKIDKLQTTSTDLSKLSNVIKTEVIKKVHYDELVKKVSSTQTADIDNVVKKADYNTKLEKTEIIPHHSTYITAPEFSKLTAEILKQD